MINLKPQAGKWYTLLATQQKKDLIQELSQAPEASVADFLTQQSTKHAISLLLQLDYVLQGAVFAQLNESKQLEIYKACKKADFAHIFTNIPSQQRADFYQTLGDREQTLLLPYLSKKIREDVIILSSYPADTAGGIMSTDFATVISEMTVKQAIDKLREDAPSKKMIFYIYVVDTNMKLLGFVSLKDLVMSAPQQRVSSSLHTNFVYSDVYEDREEVAQKVEKYDLVAIPILNEKRQLVGIVRYDDAMDVLRAEQTEDMERFMGIVSGEDETTYLQTPSFHHFRRRATWIINLFIAGFLSDLIIHHNRDIFSQLPFLWTFLPMITGAGGNAGSQSATVVIQALSIKHITLQCWLKVIWKEAKVSLMLSFCLFILGFVKVILLSGSANTIVDPMYLAGTVSLALSLQVITSTVIGAALPLIAAYLNRDPVVAASPAITTLVDITGVFIYFSVVSLCLL